MTEKIVKYIGYAVFLIVIVVSLIYFLGGTQASGLEQQLEEAKNLDSIQKQAAVSEIATGWGGGILNLSAILLGLTTVLVLGFAVSKFVIKLIDEPKSAIKSLASFAVIGIVIFIAYAMASDAIPNFLGVDKFGVTPSMSKWVGTGLFITYIFFGITFLSVIYTEVSKIWK